MKKNNYEWLQNSSSVLGCFRHCTYLETYSHPHFTGTEVQISMDSNWSQVVWLVGTKATSELGNMSPKPVHITTLLKNLSIWESNYTGQMLCWQFLWIGMDESDFIEVFEFNVWN